MPSKTLDPRDAYRGRILYLDDQVPFEYRGSGYPRSREILCQLVELGFFVTLATACRETLDAEGLSREFPDRGLEVLVEAGHRGWLPLVAERGESYDRLIVSRIHNYRAIFTYGIDRMLRGTRLVYDAETIEARREAIRRELLHTEPPAESVCGLEEELSLAARADEIWSVSRTEAELFRSTGRPVTVVSHAARGIVPDVPFGARRGLVFIASFANSWSPNVDGLQWFFDRVLPLVAEQLGEEVPVDVVGELASGVRFSAPSCARFLGRVDDLAPVYSRCRVSIAPMRFSAGISLKILNAAANGLPTVASDRLIESVGWTGGREVLSGGQPEPGRFARQVVRLYTDEALWLRLQRYAATAVRRDFSPARLRASLESALSTLGGGSR